MTSVLSVSAAAYIESVLRDAGLQEEPRDPNPGDRPRQSTERPKDEADRLWQTTVYQTQLADHYLDRLEHERALTAHYRRRANLLEHHLALQYIQAQQLQAQQQPTVDETTRVTSLYSHRTDSPPPPAQ